MAVARTRDLLVHYAILKRRTCPRRCALSDFNFDKLNALTPAQRADQQAQWRLRDIAQEDAGRDAGSKKALTITLSREPEMATLRDGQRAVVFRGVEEGGIKPLKAVFPLPLHRVENSEQGAEDLDRRLRDLSGGDKLSVAGQWKKNVWQGRESWEFNTKHFAEGAHTLDKVLEKARVDRGEIVERNETAPAMRAPARALAGREAGMGVS